MKIEDFVMDNEKNDAQYVSYHLKSDVHILGRTIHATDDIDVEISIATNENIENVLEMMNTYFEYLGKCKEQLIKYIESEAGEETLPSDWFENFDIFSVSITINSTEDYGAVIAVDDEYFGHIIELYFDKENIVDNILLG